ncbi:MAG: nucleotidyltransferase domain-containing protein [Candidatus Micrarchaeota archaeon]
MIKTVSLADILPMLIKLKKEVGGEVYVFGSVTEGVAVPFESDADILILPKGKYNRKSLFGKAWDAVKSILDIGITPHIIIYDPKRHAGLLEEVRKSGVRL